MAYPGGENGFFRSVVDGHEQIDGFYGECGKGDIGFLCAQLLLIGSDLCPHQPGGLARQLFIPGMGLLQQFISGGAVFCGIVQVQVFNDLFSLSGVVPFRQRKVGSHRQAGEQPKPGQKGFESGFSFFHGWIMPEQVLWNSSGRSSGTGKKFRKTGR